MTRVALVGYFGWGNFGDELFVDTHRQMLEPEFDLFVANDLLHEPYFSDGPQSVVDQADAILIGGGDLINPTRVSGLYWCEEFLQRPVFVYGIGVPTQPFERAAVMGHYKQFLEHDNVRLIVARDAESHAWLASKFELGDKLQWYPDAVCAYRRPEPRVATEPEFGIVMREHRSLDADMSAVRALADRATSIGYKVKHLVLANGTLGEADAGRARMIAQDGESVFQSESLQEMCYEISGLQMMASIKFHGLVVASMFGVPTIAMSVTPKNRNFLRMIQRPEMLVSYRDPTLAERVNMYPARIHSLVRGNLYRRSVAGYDVLREALRSV